MTWLCSATSMYVRTNEAHGVSTWLGQAVSLPQLGPWKSHTVFPHSLVEGGMGNRRQECTQGQVESPASKE